MNVKHTYQSVKDYVEIESESGCVLLDTEYKNINTKLKIKCRCGNIFERTYRLFRMGSIQCEKCTLEKRKLTYNEVKTFIESKNCKLLSEEYNGYNDILQIQCNCGNIYLTSFGNFKLKNKHTCDECTKKKMNKKFKLQFEDVKYFIEIKSDSGCLLLEDKYLNDNTKIKLKCSCGNHFLTTFAQFKRLNKRQCNDCGRKIQVEKQRKTHEQFCNEVYSLVGDEYSVLGEYVHNNSPLLVRHNTCISESNEYMVSPANFLSGKRCPKCAVENIKGTNSNFWKGGVTPINKLERGTSEYKQWRASVFKRDNYTCQCCGQKGHDLHAHHLENFSDNIELRYDINNGITLCKSCHYPNIKGSFHNLYGTKNNTTSQLLEYIKDFKRSKLPYAQ